jgi:hypothetical protein
LYPISGKSYEKIVQKKDYGNGTQCDTSDTEIPGMGMCTALPGAGMEENTGKRGGKNI